MKPYDEMTDNGMTRFESAAQDVAAGYVPQDLGVVLDMLGLIHRLKSEIELVKRERDAEKQKSNLLMCKSCISCRHCDLDVICERDCTIENGMAGWEFRGPCMHRTEGKTMPDSPCAYNQDEFCVNADCPYCADYCPVTEIPDVCKYYKEADKDA